MTFLILGVTDQELQALLSQNDIATSFAENLLKQFGSDDLVDIKEELPDEGGVGSSSPVNVAADSTTTGTNRQMKSPPIKCEATSTSANNSSGKVKHSTTIIPKCDIKTEPIVKIEKLLDTNDKLSFSIQMDSKQIVDVIK